MKTIVNKIKDLLRLSKSSNAHEAATAARLADELIAKHRISEAELAMSAETEEELPTEATDILYETGRLTPWKHQLMHILCHHYGCVIWNDRLRNKEYDQNGTSRFRMVGRKSDREIISYMFSWLGMEIARLTKENAYGKGKVAASSYAEGVVAGIKIQLDESKKHTKAEAIATGHGPAIVKLESRLDESRAALNELHPNLIFFKNKSFRQVDKEAHGRGVQAGKNIHLGKAMSGAATKLLS